MEENNLTEKQETAIALVLSGKNDVEIGDVIGASRKTVNRWRNHDEDFQIALAEKREGMRQETNDALQALSQKAIKVLNKALDDENVYVQLRAAALVLKACEARAKAERQHGTNEEVLKRQIVIASLTEALTEMGMTGKR